MDVPPDTLLGRWQLRRRLVDRRAARHGTVSGWLELRRDGEQLVWEESGELRWGAQRLPVSRRYLLRRCDTGWWVHFADGRPFHPWAPGELVEHPCVADLYRGVIRVDAPDRWRIGWDVSGPAKDQRIVTRLSR